MMNRIKMKPKAFIFDLDGVITDTAKHHYTAWKELSDSLGLTFNEQINERLKGVSREDSLKIILETNIAEHLFSQTEIDRVLARKNERYQELIGSMKSNEILDGILDLLLSAHQNGIMTAVASASKNAATILKQLNLFSSFEYIADPAKLDRMKPDPEIFLSCADALGVAPDECIGFEDSQAGIEAIKKAGMFAVGINVTDGNFSPDYRVATTQELRYEDVIKEYERFFKKKGR